MERLSFIDTEQYSQWFRPIWDDIPGASLKEHPAPFPLELAARLIKMFSFAGDTVLDPFGGTGTTALAARRAQRSSITYEVEGNYLPLIVKRLTNDRRSDASLMFESRSEQPLPSWQPSLVS
jgi:DNA modification methylase